jgi:CheY-like chemotaxis protein
MAAATTTTTTTATAPASAVPGPDAGDGLEGTHAPTVVAPVRRSFLRVEVRNVGRGLGGVRPDRLFRPFEQGVADVHTLQEGTGLGLPICRMLAQLMGGAVSIGDEALHPDAGPSVLHDNGGGHAVLVRTVFALEVPLLAPGLSDGDERAPSRDPATSGPRAVGGVVASPAALAVRVADAHALSEAEGEGGGAASATATRDVDVRVSSAPSAHHVVAVDPVPPIAARRTGSHSPSASAPADLSPSPLASSVPARVAGPLAVRELRTLVVDDEAVNVRVMRRILAPTGCLAHSASDGDEAVSLVEAAGAAGTPFHVVLLDIVMTRMSGEEACRRMRAAGFAGWVVACTGNASAEDRRRYRGAGFSGTLAKPFGREDVHALLGRAGGAGGVWRADADADDDWDET